MEWVKENWVLVLLITICWIYWTIVKAQNGANASPKDYAEEQRKHQERVAQAKSSNSTNGNTEGNTEPTQEQSSGGGYQIGAWGSNQSAPVTQPDSRVTYTDTMSSEEVQSTSLDAHQHEQEQQQALAEERERF